VSERTGDVQLCTLRVGDGWFAVDIMRVREVATAARITAVPGSDGGVIEVQGRLAPVIDLRRRMKLPPLPEARGPRVVVLAVGEALVAVLADRVTEVMRVPASALKALPRGKQQSMIAGAARHEGRVLLLLDVKGLLETGKPRRRRAATRARS
jgi:purine-binding chemotaxis protein CheW